MKLSRDNLLFLTLVVGLSTLAIQLYLFHMGLFTPVSPLFRRQFSYIAFFNEYTPLAITLMILVWMRMGKLSKKDNDLDIMNIKWVALVLVSFTLVNLIWYRLWDIAAMLTQPHNNPDVFNASHAEIWMRISFFFALSVILFGYFTISSGLRGLKTMFIVSLIPAFYTFNTDIVVYADRISGFSIFYPIFQFILAFGRFEALTIGGLLNVFGVKTLVYANTFPYRMMLGGATYVIDLPCIGWEGVVGYTIIFLVFISDLEISKKLKLVLATLGFLGTLFVNLLRLTLIFFAGAIWGASVADIIHRNAGDVIFLVWILGFLYVVLWYLKKIATPLTHEKNVNLNDRQLPAAI